MNSSELLLSCDWGTSNFRLKLINRVDGTPVAKCKANLGIKKVFKSWKKSDVGRIPFFQSVLQLAVEELEIKSELTLKGIPIVVSGMASSSLGLKELPYAPIPFAVNGESIQWEKISGTSDFAHDLFLISGIEKTGDVIRGEETQVVGLMNTDHDFPEKFCLILPGTHSKHLIIDKTKITDFRTFPTGEMFQILRKHSALKNRMSKKLSKKLKEADIDSFLQGVEAGKTPDINRQIFSIRAKSLQGTLKKSEAIYYLSGLLIGHELQDLTKTKFKTVVLSCNKEMKPFYQLALHYLGREDTIIINPKSYSKLVSRAHVMLFNKYFSTVHSLKA